MNEAELLRASAVDQARLIREGALRSEDLVRLYLDRIARHDAELHAFVQVIGARALFSARRKDLERRLRGGRDLPPFHGVPIGIKDLNHARGTFTRFGSRMFKYLWSPVDDASTAQIRQGGFVILGKLSASEFGALPVTEPDIHPPTRNPWDLGFTSGGSSGGSGAAVAAGLLPIAQGSDGAGSIRIPSAFCHLYGIKPSRGRVVDAYDSAELPSLAIVGPMARSVDDAAALLDVMAGVSSGRPSRAPRPERPFAELARRRPSLLRVRYTVESPLLEAHPDIAAATRDVARRLADMGHQVEEGGPPQGTVEEFLPMWQFSLARVPMAHDTLMQPVSSWLVRAGKTLRLEDVRRRHLELEERVNAWFGDVDLWVTPTVADVPARIGAWRGLDPEATFRRAARFGAFTAIFNVTGQPAASLPVGLTREGLPMGVQIAGRPLADGVVLAVSRQLEAEMRWEERRSRFT